ncbi:MAG: hypothetical protein M3Q14_03895 [bacterium]|nr:hypothetical protein [bacterium]
MKQRIQRLLLALGLVAPMLAAVPVRAAAVTQFDFTATELSTNWGPERIAPSGGYSSVTYADRSNVAEININSSVANENVYYRTEGIKTSKGEADNFDAPGNFGESVKIDLYLDPAWDSTAVRAGLWTVGDNNAMGTDAANFPFGILEFANVTGYEGFRYFNTTTGTWQQVAGFTSYGNWATLQITLDADANLYRFSINGTEVGTSASPEISTYLYSVMLNQRNFGRDDQAGLDLNEVSYTAHWHGGLAPLSDKELKEQCKKNGWKTMSAEGKQFKNQGDCVSYYASGNRNKPANTSALRF